MGGAVAWAQEHRKTDWFTPHSAPTQQNHGEPAPYSLRAPVGTWLIGWLAGEDGDPENQRRSVKWQSKCASKGSKLYCDFMRWAPAVPPVAAALGQSVLLHNSTPNITLFSPTWSIIIVK